MKVQHLSNAASVEEATQVVREHGHVVIDDLASTAVIDHVLADMKPYMDTQPYTRESLADEKDSTGVGTQRIGNLIARSPAGRDLIMNPLVLGVVKNVLSGSSLAQLSTTEMISLSPGAPAQFIHRDEITFDDFPFPDDYVASCNTLWALTEYTEENGATRIVPGSHARPPADYTIEDTVPVEMARGSVMIFTSKLWHGGGHNRSKEVRRAQAVNYAVGWVRQEENQFLACPAEIARTLPEELLKLIGYQVGPKYGYGHAGSQVDPIRALMQPESLLHHEKYGA